MPSKQSTYDKVGVVLLLTLIVHTNAEVRCSDPCLTRLGFTYPCTSNPSHRIGQCYSAYYGECSSSISETNRKCAEAQSEERARKELAAARARQRAKRVALANKQRNEDSGIVLVPGPRGHLGHAKRCRLANDDRMTELLEDASDKAWGDDKKFWSLAAKLIFSEDDFESKDWLNNVEEKCRDLAGDIARINWINSIGGENLEDALKKNCELEGHAESVAEKGFVAAMKLAYNTHVGEYLSVALSSDNNSQDFCAMVCRKNHSGVRLNACAIGCAETFQDNCWSQCDVYTCERGCLNAFPKIPFWDWNKNRRGNCYNRCKSKCTFH